MSTTKKYIAVDAANDTTNDKIIMNNENNVVCGTLKTKDENDNMTDINDIFFKKGDFETVEEVEI